MLKSKKGITMTTIKLFDETVLTADVVEEKAVIRLTVKLANRSEYSKIFDMLVDSNLVKVTVTHDDGSHSDYQNLKFLSMYVANTSGTYSVVAEITAKTIYEMAVDGLTKDVNESNTELTKTQLALVEIYESLLVV
jgi:uncharacterized protein YqfB (UPF0267 family)